MQINRTSFSCRGNFRPRAQIIRQYVHKQIDERPWYSSGIQRREWEIILLSDAYTGCSVWDMILDNGQAGLDRRHRVEWRRVKQRRRDKPPLCMLMRFFQRRLSVLIKLHPSTHSVWGVSECEWVPNGEMRWQTTKASRFLPRNSIYSYPLLWRLPAKRNFPTSPSKTAPAAKSHVRKQILHMYTLYIPFLLSLSLLAQMHYFEWNHSSC